MNTGHRTIVALLTVIAVLLALNLIASSSPAAQAEGGLRRCCFPHNGSCLLFTLVDCIAFGGIPGPPGSDCTFECGPGACCVGDNCLVTFDEESCISQGGIYQGWDPAPDCAAIQCEAAPPCPADLDNDGEIGIVDFLILLSLWGPCP